MNFEEFYKIITNDPNLRQAGNGDHKRYESNVRASFNNLNVEEIPDNQAELYAEVIQRSITVGIIAGREIEARKNNRH
ncbi:MAG TPA: hypothetical protein VI815_00075 [Candidatus Nanoarchaeia archaeon]|nr:hypothetical protein [Candidatus Nanoarchaeia archaeon]